MRLLLTILGGITFAVTARAETIFLEFSDLNGTYEVGNGLSSDSRGVHFAPPALRTIDTITVGYRITYQGPPGSVGALPFLTFETPDAWGSINLLNVRWDSDSYSGRVYVVSSRSDGWGDTSILDRIPMGFRGFDDITNSQRLISAIPVGSVGLSRSSEYILAFGGDIGLNVFEVDCGAVCSGVEQTAVVSDAWLVFEGQAVPEPATLSLLIAAGVVAVLRSFWTQVAFSGVANVERGSGPAVRRVASRTTIPAESAAADPREGV